MVRSSTRDSCTRTNQNAGPHRRKLGQQRAAPISQGAGSILDRRGNRQPQIHTGRVAGSEYCPPIARISTKVQRGRGDAGRGMGLQRGRAKAKTTAITKFRGICNLVILIIIYLNGQSTNIKRLNTTELLS